MNEKLLKEYEQESIDNLMDISLSLANSLNEHELTELSDAITDLMIARKAMNLFFENKLKSASEKIEK